MRWRVLTVALALVAVLAALIAAPTPAQAFSGDKFGSKILETGADTFGIATEWVKVVRQEATPEWVRARYVFGTPIAMGLGIIGSTLARGVSTGGDWVTHLLLVDEHIVKQRAFDNWEPLWSVPK